MEHKIDKQITAATAVAAEMTAKSVPTATIRNYFLKGEYC